MNISNSLQNHVIVNYAGKCSEIYEIGRFQQVLPSITQQKISENFFSVEFKIYQALTFKQLVTFSNKAIPVMPGLFLQNPTMRPKLKDTFIVSNGRIKLQDEGNINNIIFEETDQRPYKRDFMQMNIVKFLPYLTN